MLIADEPELEVVVIEDHLTIRKGIELLLRAEGMRIAGVASRVDEARSLMARRRYDVALMDVRLGDESSVTLAEELLRVDPAMSIVFYTGYTGLDSGLDEAVRVGARGFVLKASPPARLVQALRAVAAGGTYVDPDLAPLLVDDEQLSRLPLLSPREYQVLELLADGLTGQAISEQLFLSP
jgi:DNA-binding NarL/FixJ family response regulator